MESFRGAITFQSIVLTRVHSTMGYVRVFILTFEISLHAHLQNVVKYDYLIIKTKEGISLI